MADLHGVKRGLLSDLAEDALTDYRTARARLERVRGVWAKAGEPALADGSTGQTICHPLLGELRQLEGHVERLRGVAGMRIHNDWCPPGETVKLRSAS